MNSEIKDCIIVATTTDFAGNDSIVYTVVENDNLKFLRYTPYRNAAANHDGKPARYSKDDATRLTVQEARKVLTTEFARRGDEPEKHFWARELRIVENP